MHDARPALQRGGGVEAPVSVGREGGGGGERPGDGDQLRARMLYFARLMAAAILLPRPAPPQRA